MPPKPRKTLTLEERVKVINMNSSGKSCKKIAEELGVGKTQIQCIMKRKAEVLEDFESSTSLNRKRKMRKTGNEEINELLLKWFTDCTARRIPVTGPLMKEKALQFASQLSNEDFKASNGWLDSFVKRNNIKFGKLHGEAGDVADETVADWKSKLTELCAGYSPRDIYNMDETGLFFRATTKHSYHFKGSDCSGGKHSKDRLTVALCANLNGDKEPALVIGKAEKPRCFSRNNIKSNSLPVTYFANSKAWMTSSLFERWLLAFDRKLKNEKRKILLFLDNAPSHPKISLDNIKLLFFPPNTTAKSQPMDQGIIQAMKLKYRKRQLQFMIAQMDKDTTLSGPEILKKITVLESIYWIDRSWKEVESSTVQKCFARCGFSAVEIMDEDDGLDDVPLSVLKLSKEVFGVQFSELMKIDSELMTHSSEMPIDWSKPAGEILHSSEDKEDPSEEGDCDKSQDEDRKVCTLSTALHHLEELKAFVTKNGKCTAFESLMDVEEDLINMVVHGAVKQTSIQDFFKPT